MPDNASRRGAVDMGMPLMILAFLVIGGFMWWLKGQAADEMAARVVEEVVEEAAMPEGGVGLGEVTAVGNDLTAFVGEVIRGVGYEVASVFGTAGFWVTTQNGNPFLVAYTEELRATGITIQQGDIAKVKESFYESTEQGMQTFDQSLLKLYHDGKVSMDRLAGMIRATQFSENRSLELLTLSACQTAVGDERAALGLAGLAVKSGARSALATLWSVNDEASAALIIEFYAQLANPELSRAQALQRAQVMMLEVPDFKHAAYWAPYMLINSWL